MPNYRRIRVPGGTCFFTVNLADRQGRLLVDHVEALRASFRETRCLLRFDVIAIVVLPDHLHCLWRLPDGDADNASRWARIKSGFSRRLPRVEPRSPSRRGKRERGIWQRRFWERVILDEDDLRSHIDYIHINPVKHGHAAVASHWPYSSIHRYVAKGVLTDDWAGRAARSVVAKPAL